MTKNLILVTIISCLTLCITNTSFAEDPFHIDGYLFTNFGFHQRGSKLQCTGRISGGKFCNNLLVKIQARSDQGDIASFQTTIERAGTHGAIFNDKRRHHRRKERSWKITNVRTYCLK